MKRVLALCGAAAVLAGCGGTSSSSEPSSPTPTVSPTVSPASYAASSAACDKSVLPAGYRLDAAHSGTVTARTYSATADVQAALLYDKLQAGNRQVYLHGPTKHADSVVSCAALSFPDSDTLGRFFGSFRELRRQAKAVVTKLASQPITGTVGAIAWNEKEQSFSGYGITSTTVLETAAIAGNTLYITTVSGAHPSRSLATHLLTSMVSSK